MPTPGPNTIPCFLDLRFEVGDEVRIGVQQPQDRQDHPRPIGAVGEEDDTGTQLRIEVAKREHPLVKAGVHEECFPVRLHDFPDEART